MQQDQVQLRMELDARARELEQLNRELDETNRGVMALYAELDEKAEALRRASELKSRFLSNMTHEFRTPLNSILSLSQILLDRLDGHLTEEQEKQVQFIRRGASELAELVNDLLDLAKVEAGKMTVRPASFEAAALLGALRGMMRPLTAGNSAVTLIFEEPCGIPTLFTDENKVAQILRNFISNALKFTEQGEVRVSAAFIPPDHVLFSVADTGMGISQADQARIFEEFTQVEGLSRARGTGLGLPLSKKMAELLGGEVHLASAPGAGSNFAVKLPVKYSGQTH